MQNRAKATFESIELTEEVRTNILRDRLADYEYENMPDDEAYSIVHKHVHGEVFTMPLNKVLQKCRLYGISTDIQ